MNGLKVVYRWIECWDGGEGSKAYDSFEECKAAAIEHVKAIRWTKREMELQTKKLENLVMIDKCYLNEDGEEVSFESTGWSIEVNEGTVDRMY